MESLTANDVIEIWECGQTEHSVERALTVLAVACPHKTRDQLATLSVGYRDRFLLVLRRKTFGDVISSFVKCPNCSEPLEFALSSQDIEVQSNLVEYAEDDPMQEWTFRAGGYEIIFRLPNTQDLRSIAGVRDTAAARQCLLERCLFKVRCNDESVDLQQVPPEVMNAFARRMSECDPQAETLFDMQCPSCNHRWQALFDINEFFWVELTAYAKRLLQEVHALASAYSWREAEILAMSPRRRRCYMEMLGA